MDIKEQMKKKAAHEMQKDQREDEKKSKSENEEQETQRNEQQKKDGTEKVRKEENKAGEDAPMPYDNAAFKISFAIEDPHAISSIQPPDTPPPALAPAEGGENDAVYSFSSPSVKSLCAKWPKDLSLA